MKALSQIKKEKEFRKGVEKLKQDIVQYKDDLALLSEKYSALIDTIHKLSIDISSVEPFDRDYVNSKYDEVLQKVQSLISEAIDSIDIHTDEVDLSPVYKAIQDSIDNLSSELQERIASITIPEQLNYDEELQEIRKLIDSLKYTYRGGGATKLSQLNDVNLSELEKDENGKYILGAGEKLGFQSAQFDFDQPDYKYIGGINAKGNFQINRYSKSEPYTREYAFGDWNDRLTLTYTLV